jgi:hypothetical protein
MQVLGVTPSKLLPLALGAQLASLPLCLLISLRDFLLARDERGVRRRSSRSRFVSVLRHLTCTPHRSLRKLATGRMRERDIERWRRPLDCTGARVSAGRWAYSHHYPGAPRPRPHSLNLYTWTGRGVGNTRVGPARVRLRSVSSALLAFRAAFQPESREVVTHGSRSREALADPGHPRTATPPSSFYEWGRSWLTLAVLAAAYGSPPLRRRTSPLVQSAANHRNRSLAPRRWSGSASSSRTTMLPRSGTRP